MTSRKPHRSSLLKEQRGILAPQPYRDDWEPPVNRHLV